MMLLCIITPAIFASCGGDDDKDEDIDNGGDKENTSIVGTWSDDGTDDWYDEGGDAYGYTFKSNGSYINYSSSRYEGKYKIKGNMIEIYEDDDPDYSYIYKYEVSGDRLILTEYDEDEDEYDDPEVYYRVK